MKKETNYQHDGSFWICKTCIWIRSNLLNGEYLEEILDDIIEEENIDDMKEVDYPTVGIIGYETEECMGSTFLPLISRCENKPYRADSRKTERITSKGFLSQGRSDV